MQEDDYGIPNNMFGPVPDVFFATVGRVVMVASLLEVRLLDLLTELDRASQEQARRHVSVRAFQVGQSPVRHAAVPAASFGG